jgi:RimJ/RimL family protein N-acetyltransferase
VALEPLDERDWHLLWGWIHERPEAHFDDSCPLTFPQFRKEISGRLKRKEQLWGIHLSGLPVGAIGYVPINHRLGMLHGVCVSRLVSGRGIAEIALHQLLDRKAAQGVEKVSAAYFWDNAHIRACLSRVGFVDEGILRGHTTKQGVPVDMRLVAKWLKDKG